MTGRTINYYQTVTDPAFARHMIEEIGLSERDMGIAWNFRKYTGDTNFYADKANMPVKKFNETAGNIHRREMDELLRLALIGWREEKKRNKS